MRNIFKVDLHIHSRYSGDNDSDPEDIIERAIELGLDGIAFTEHYYYEASEEILPLIEKYKKTISIIRGVEFSTTDGHCLIFGVNTDKLAEKEISMSEMATKVNSSGGVLIPAHPYRGVNSIGDSIFKISGLIALEGYNGCSMPIMNNKAIQTASRLNIPYTGGSDSHTPKEVGSCYTIFYEPVSEDNIVSLLKSRNFAARDNRRFGKIFNYFFS
ncbi:MAG: PHP domain-containing protein [Thermodesulfovibrionales bacterium]|nr:PHP domain-containing protein [Thermodesulfovibrionales bacterium]